MPLPRPGAPVFAKATARIWKSLPLSRQSFSRWRKQGLYAGPLLLGPVLFTWSINLMAPGDLVETSAASTLPLSQTDTLYSLFLISPLESLAPSSSPNLISRNPTQPFQRMMDRIFSELPFCFIYLDDILVISNSLESHQQHFCSVFVLCHLHGITINLEKCAAFCG